MRAHASLSAFMTLWILDLPELIQHEHDETLKSSYVLILVDEVTAELYHLNPHDPDKNDDHDGSFYFFIKIPILHNKYD